MSTLTENVAKVTAAHAALKEAIAAKGVAVPEGTKLSGMPALVGGITTPPVPTNPRAVFTFDGSNSLVLPKVLVVDLSTMTDFIHCFHNCAFTSLTLPDGFGKNATRLGACFLSCTSLTSLTLPDGFGQNVENPTGLRNMLARCSELMEITGNPNFKVSFYLADSTKLTHDSLMVVINGLQTVTTTQTLTIGATNLAKLSDEDKKVATDKGWTLA